MTFRLLNDHAARSESQAQPASIQAPGTPSRTGSAADPDVVAPTTSMFGQTNDAEQMRMQEEYMRALLAGAPQGQEPGMQGEDDPMLKMMQAMLGNVSGDPNAPGSEGMPFSADDISKMTGLPSFLTSMFLGGKQQAPPTPEEIKIERTWKVLRTIMVGLVGLYTIFTIDKSVKAFGQDPPVPATAQNPFLVFLMGELLVNGARTVLSGRPASRSGFKAWIHSGRETARDGALLLFMFGTYSRWWKDYT